MAAKLRQYGSRLCFLCPGCEDLHQVVVDGPNSWTWNGSIDAPTIDPSVLVQYGSQPGDKRCHSFVRSGRIEFLADSTHALAGQTADLPDYEWPA